MVILLLDVVVLALALAVSIVALPIVATYGLLTRNSEVEFASKELDREAKRFELPASGCGVFVYWTGADPKPFGDFSGEGGVRGLGNLNTRGYYYLQADIGTIQIQTFYEKPSPDGSAVYTDEDLIELVCDDTSSHHFVEIHHDDHPGARGTEEVVTVREVSRSEGQRAVEERRLLSEQ